MENQETQQTAKSTRNAGVYVAVTPSGEVIEMDSKKAVLDYINSGASIHKLYAGAKPVVLKSKVTF